MWADDVRPRYGRPDQPYSYGSAVGQPRPTSWPRRRTPRIALLEWAVYGVILAYVWRLQDLYPILATLQFPSIISLTAFVVFASSPERRELRRIRHPILKTSMLILGLMILSVPLSLYRGMSFWFIFSDHLKTFIMMLIIAASIRTVKDVERLAIVHLCGA